LKNINFRTTQELFKCSIATKNDDFPFIPKGYSWT